MAANHDSNVTPLRNEYTARKQAQIANVKSGMSKIRKRRAWFIFAVFLLFAIPLSVSIITTQMQVRGVQSQIVASEKKLKSKQADSKALNKEIKLLNDDKYLLKVVRSKYYYSKSGETIYNLEGSNDSSK